MATKLAMALFQHTAARRRLVSDETPLLSAQIVSTHSRPKAAGSHSSSFVISRLFQHTAARRRLEIALKDIKEEWWFQHTAARRRLAGSKLEKAKKLGMFQHTAARRRLASSAIRT